jgi:hypothetical protein
MAPTAPIGRGFWRYTPSAMIISPGQALLSALSALSIAEKTGAELVSSVVA